MKTIILILLLGSITWACTQADKSDKPSAIPANKPDPLEKVESDPLWRQFRRFGFDVSTGKYNSFHGYQKEGC